MTWTVKPWPSASNTPDVGCALRRWCRVAFFLNALAFGITANADPLLDFSMFNAPDPSKRAIGLPTVSWIVHPQAETYCQHAQPKDGYFARPEGCVYWQIAAARCTLVTRPSTTHSQLGHLLLHCMEGK